MQVVAKTNSTSVAAIRMYIRAVRPKAGFAVSRQLAARPARLGVFEVQALDVVLSMCAICVCSFMNTAHFRVICAATLVAVGGFEVFAKLERSSVAATLCK